VPLFGVKMFLKGDTRRKYINARGPSPDLFKNTNFETIQIFSRVENWYETYKITKALQLVKAHK